MGITMVIVGGIVVVSLAGVIGDYLTKAKHSASVAAPSELQELRTRVETLERQAEERESRIERLEGDVAFTTKLLEDKHSGDAR